MGCCKGQTVRVRVAVVVDKYGSWRAAGQAGQGDADAIDAAVENALTSGVEAVRFIEADVPLPEKPPTVAARAMV